MRRTPAAAALLAAAGLLVAGCGSGTDSTAGPSGPTSPASASSTVTPSATGTPASPGPTERVRGTVPLGHTFRMGYSTALFVTVSPPQHYTPKHGQYVPGLGHPVVFHVSVVNHTHHVVPLHARYRISTRQSDGTSSVVNADRSAAPRTRLAPGEAVRFDVAAKVLDPHDLTFDFAPNAAAGHVLFTG